MNGTTANSRITLKIVTGYFLFCIDFIDRKTMILLVASTTTGTKLNKYGTG